MPVAALKCPVRQFDGHLLSSETCSNGCRFTECDFAEFNIQAPSARQVVERLFIAVPRNRVPLAGDLFNWFKITDVATE
jgi:hypothetical protein